MVTATTKFALSKKPKAGTIKVTIGGAFAPQGQYWDYDPVINQIVLKGGLPANNTPIAVCYEPA